MRGARERDEQTLVIAGALALFAVIVVTGVLCLLVLDLGLGVSGATVSRLAVRLVLGAAALAVVTVVRRERRSQPHRSR